MQDYRCQRLPNGVVLVRSMGSGLETLYDPQTDALRGPSIHWAGHDLAAARTFVEKLAEQKES